jgi:hypothetical protein
MPKKLDPTKDKPFQPLAPDLVRSVIDNTSTATAVAEPPEEMDEIPAPEPAAVRARTKRSDNVVSMRRTQGAEEPEARMLPEPGGERLNRPLKVQLAPSERNELQRIVNLLSQELGTPVSASHVTRSLLAIFRNAESLIINRARQTGTLKRPPNDDLTAIAAFEFRLAKLLAGALREAAPLRE